ncbi:gasdermin-E-like [Hippocampus zosterae]|uniref:gasdermin-E-like n=1 Tax=Hippocampus zosterae TaxID=109293 RepID=UPI00223D2F7E|nr:gasdermin-E-like [Hippocampus zosterae]
MFSKATANFVRQVDPEGSLIHVSRMNDSSKLLPMALVVKRKRVWFWQRPKYRPTDFKLNDLLLGEKGLTPVVSKKEFVTYMGIFGNKLAGKLDTEAASVGVKVEAVGSSKLQSDFGMLKKEEVDVNKLLQDSNKRLVDMEHVLVQQLEKRSDILAVVKERILTTAACTVTQTKKEQCALHAMVGLLGKLGANVKVCIKESNDIEANMDVCLEIPSDVVIAYSVLELNIEKDGHFKICLQPGLIGGFEADKVRSWSSQDDIDVVDGRCFDGNILEESPQQNGAPVEDLSPLAALPPSTRWALYCKLQDILRDRVTLSHLQCALEELCVGRTPDTTRQETLPDSVENASPSLHAVHLLVTALEELPDKTLSLMCDSQPEFIKAFSILLNMMKESGRALSLECLPTPMREEQTFQQAKKLLGSIGVTISVDGDQLWWEKGVKSQIQFLVLCLSAYGMSLLCSGQKQELFSCVV